MHNKSEQLPTAKHYSALQLTHNHFHNPLQVTANHLLLLSALFSLCHDVLHLRKNYRPLVRTNYFEY